MRMNILVALLVTFLVGGCTDGVVELTPDELRASDELRDSGTNAIVAGDAAAYAKLCTEDVRRLHAGSRKYVHVFRRGSDGKWRFAH